jgi:hypothetical protein
MENLSFTAQHSACLYHTNAEQATIVARFLRSGLTRQEKILYIIDPWGNGSFLNGLPHDEVDVASAIRRGQLTFLTTTETYLQTTPFDPAHMVQILHRETDRAIGEGYTGLRVTADMTWALHHNVPPHTLIEYETQVDTFLNHGTCTGLCRYDRWRFPSTILEEVIPIHASIITQGREYINNARHIFSDLLRDLDNTSH